MNKYLKRLAFANLSFLFLATSAFAGGAYMPPAKPYFDGFYGGIGIGAVAALSDVKTSSEIPGDPAANNAKNDPPPLISGSRDLDLGKGGFNANIFFGYGKTLNRSYYLGGELFGNYFTPKASGSYYSTSIIGLNVSTHDSVENRYSFGGDIRAGYLVSPRTMLYILFGLDYAKFNVNSETAVTLPIDSLSPSVNNNFSKWKLGYMPGVGIETGLTDHLSIRAQGTYTYFPSFSHSNTKYFNIEEDKFKLNTDTKVKPSRWLFTVMLSYLFN